MHTFTFTILVGLVLFSLRNAPTDIPYWVICWWCAASALGLWWSEKRDSYGDWMIGMISCALWIIGRNAIPFILEAGCINSLAECPPPSILYKFLYTFLFDYGLILFALLPLEGWRKEAFATWMNTRRTRRDAH
jgi:hypothetical protein